MAAEARTVDAHADGARRRGEAEDRLAGRDAGALRGCATRLACFSGSRTPSTTGWPPPRTRPPLRIPGKVPVKKMNNIRYF